VVEIVSSDDVTGKSIMSPIDERRLKILSIKQTLFIDILNWWRNPSRLLALPIIEELPADCIVVSVVASWERGCIEAIVASTEFPCCPDGQVLERIPGIATELRVVAIEAAAEIEELKLYKRAMESMAAQFIHPKTTALELAKSQLGVV
jgi:hypothetical protein